MILVMRSTISGISALFHCIYDRVMIRTVCWTSNSNFKTTSNLPSANFLFHISFEKNYLSPTIPKITKKITKKPEMLICDMSIEIFDYLKRERDIYVKTITPSRKRPLGVPRLKLFWYCTYCHQQDKPSSIPPPP